MAGGFERYLDDLDVEPGAPIDAVETFQASTGFVLPKDYADFLRFSNGAAGLIGDNYVVLWQVEELAKFNAGYRVDTFAPGLFLFGSDGAGEAFAFDRRRHGPPIVAVPFIPLSTGEAVDLAPTFEGFLQTLHEGADFLGQAAPKAGED